MENKLGASVRRAIRRNDNLHVASIEFQTNLLDRFYMLRNLFWSIEDGCGTIWHNARDEAADALRP
jgi:hypothetical protein